MWEKFGRWQWNRLSARKKPLSIWARFSSSARCPILLSRRWGTATAGFLTWYEAAPTTHFRGLATLTNEDFAQELLAWRVNEQVPGMRARTAAKLAHSTARRLCNLEPWPAAIAPATAAPPPPGPQEQAEQAAADQVVANSNLVPASSTGTRVLNVQTIKLDTSLDHRLTAEITYLPHEKVIKTNAVYRKFMDEHCDTNRAPTLEQLTYLEQPGHRTQTSLCSGPTARDSKDEQHSRAAWWTAADNYTL